MESSEGIREYSPELSTRLGEMYAWLTTVLTFIGWLVLAYSGRPIISAIPFMAFFFLLVSLGISLSNWMDRRTKLGLSTTGVTFRNGLRNVELSWAQINQVEVLGSNWGKKVRVYGENGHFDFRTLGEFKMSGEVKGRMGFIDGEMILQQILAQSGLKEVDHVNNSYYYARR